MSFGFPGHNCFVRMFAVGLIVFCCLVSALAQSSDDEIDPIKLFESGQDAHARGELERAIQLYEEAIALRPDFPEAEYQRASALISLGRFGDAEKSLGRAIELRSEWSLPYTLLGGLMVRQKRFANAEAPLTIALKLEPQNSTALIALADLRLQTKASREVLTQLLGLFRVATSKLEAPAGLWISRGSIERALGDKEAALASFARALSLDPRSTEAYLERAEIFAGMGEIDRAIESAKAAQRIVPVSIYVATALTRLYMQAGDCAAALGTLDELDSATKRPGETASLRNVIVLECATGDKERGALEKALVKEPRNASVLARLCVLYRVDDPPRAMDYCRRALDIEPHNVDYGNSYAAALVQARRFEDAVSVLQRVIAVAPDKFTAHTNLAIALYQLQRLPEALIQYKWIILAKPETTAAYFFIAIIYDKLGEYPVALVAYQDFLARAEPQQFKLEIDKVNLRLPTLRNQIKLGQGAKRKS